MAEIQKLAEAVVAEVYRLGAGAHIVLTDVAHGVKQDKLNIGAREFRRVAKNPDGVVLFQDKEHQLLQLDPVKNQALLFPHGSVSAKEEDKNLMLSEVEQIITKALADCGIAVGDLTLEQRRHITYAAVRVVNLGQRNILSAANAMAASISQVIQAESEAAIIDKEKAQEEARKKEAQEMERLTSLGIAVERENAAQPTHSIERVVMAASLIGLNLLVNTWDLVVDEYKRTHDARQKELNIITKGKEISVDSAISPEDIANTRILIIKMTLARDLVYMLEQSQTCLDEMRHHLNIMKEQVVNEAQASGMKVSNYDELQQQPDLALISKQLAMIQQWEEELKRRQEEQQVMENQNVGTAKLFMEIRQGGFKLRKVEKGEIRDASWADYVNNSHEPNTGLTM